MDQEHRVISQLKIIVTLYINRFLYLWVKTPVHSSVITVKRNKRLYSNQLKTCRVVDRVSENSPCSYLVCLARCWVGWEGRMSKSSVFAQSTASGKLSDLGSSCGFFTWAEVQLHSPWARGVLKISSRHDFTEFCSEVEVKLGRKWLQCRMQQVLKLIFVSVCWDRATGRWVGPFWGKCIRAAVPSNVSEHKVRVWWVHLRRQNCGEG